MGGFPSIEKDSIIAKEAEEAVGMLDWLWEEQAPRILAVVGCGGKTSLIGQLAEEWREKKVLVTPTTKILPIEGRDIILKSTLSQCREHRPAKGIQCMGLLNRSSGKLEALPLSLLEEMMPSYDLTLLEADGSRGLPCKGWAGHEPVIPSSTTHTIGVVTLKGLGKPVGEDTVLRLPEFLALTGLGAGEEITLEALTRMVCAPGGMLWKSMGKVCLLVNQVEDKATAQIAGEWLAWIKEAYPGRFFKLAYGSIKENSWQEV